MNKFYLAFESKEQYEKVMTDSEWPNSTSFVFPILTEETGDVFIDEFGDEQKEVIRKEGFFINVLGEIPECLIDYSVEVESPQYKWA